MKIYVSTIIREDLNEFATRELKRIGMGAEGHVFSTGNYAIKKIIANGINTQEEMVRLYGLNKALQKLHHPHLADILDIKIEGEEDGKIKAIEILKEKLEKLNPEEYFHFNDLTLLLAKIGVRRNLKRLKDKIVYDKVTNNIDSVGNENIRKNLWGVIDASLFLLNNNMDKYFWEGKYDLNSKNVMKDSKGVFKIIDF